MKQGEFIKRADVLHTESPLFNIPGRKEYILKEIGRGKRVLDLGCLGGQISKLIKDQNNEVFGVEANPRAAEAAQSLGIKVKIFDLNDGIPFEDCFFDVVHAGEIIESIYDTKFLFEEVNRVLKPCGVFVFSTLNLNSITNRINVLTGGYLSSTGAFPEDFRGENIRHFNLFKLRELCVHTGFRILDVRGVFLDHKKRLGSWAIQSFVRIMPQFGEMLLVKARRVDD